jgi:hypothetical protein
VAKIHVTITREPEEPKKFMMAFSAAKKAIDGRKPVTVLLADDFFPLVRQGAANISSDDCQCSLRESSHALLRQDARVEVCGPAVQPSKLKSKQLKSLPGSAVHEAPLRLSADQDRIFRY